MPLRTLIVDDEALARARLRTLLGDCTEPAADVVSEATHAAQARQLLQSTAFDLVLLDIHMPGMDGLELARVIAELPDAPALVFVTAHSMHAVTAFELDVVDYLTKPCGWSACSRRCRRSSAIARTGTRRRPEPGRRRRRC